MKKTTSFIRFSLCLLVACFAPFSTAGQPKSPGRPASPAHPQSAPLIWSTTLTSLDGAAEDHFGYSVALSSDGSTGILGTYWESQGNGPKKQGRAYVFTRDGAAWTQQAKLSATEGAAGDEFGYSVALSSDGNTALVGAIYTTVDGKNAQGAAYVFTRTGTNWTEQKWLLASEGTANDFFGSAVALSSDGNTALIGAKYTKIGDKNFQGAAYVFSRSGTEWTERPRLTAADGAASDQFGTSVALSSDGSTALIGAIEISVGDWDSQGAAYVFTRSGESWLPQAELTAGDRAEIEQIGTSVALSSDGNTALVGAGYARVGNVQNQGAAYVFTRSASTWTQQAKLIDEAGTSYEGFGWSVALTGDGSTALIGAPGAHGKGTTFGFVRSGTSWSQVGELAPSEAYGGSFGSAVGVNSAGSVALVGAPYSSVDAQVRQGLAYGFVILYTYNSIYLPHVRR
jgi:hypothetical protein